MKVLLGILIAIVIVGGGIFIYEQHESLALVGQQQALLLQQQQQKQQQLATLPVQVRSFKGIFSPFVRERLLNHSGRVLDCTVTLIYNAAGTRDTRHLTLQPYGQTLWFTGFRVGDQIRIASDGYATMQYTVLGR